MIPHTVVHPELHPSPPIHIGTSAWSFDDWRGVFYPDHLPPGERLAFYARFFTGVEIDTTFYASPAARVVSHWAEVTPQAFVFASKLSREITHERRLRECDELLESFLTALEPLGSKHVCTLVQLPPSFVPKHDETALREFVRRLPARHRFAIEFRDPAWHLPRIIHLLEEHHVCWVWNDVSTSEHAAEAAFGSWPQTTDFLYLRLLGDLDTKYDGEGERVHRYRHLQWPRDEALASWVEKVRAVQPGVRRVLAFAANHFEGFAPASAARIAERFGQRVSLPSVAELAGEDPRQMDLF